MWLKIIYDTKHYFSRLKELVISDYYYITSFKIACLSLKNLTLNVYFLHLIFLIISYTSYISYINQTMYI